MSSTKIQRRSVKRGDLVRLLIVEDDPALSKTYFYLLGDTYALSLVKTGEHALNTLRHHKEIGLVLLDYQLPDMSGIDVLQSIKRIRPNVPVIFITAFGNEDVAVKAFTSGAVDYIKKPFTYAELTEKIRISISRETIPRKLTKRPEIITAPSALVEKNRNGHSSGSNFIKVQKAIKYIEDNYAVKACFEGAAERACLSKFHFSRVFRQITGISFREHVLNMKMEKAKELLKKGSLTVSQITDAVGYEDASHFVKVFKKRVGCTPLVYRQAHEASLPPDALDNTT